MSLEDKVGLLILAGFDGADLRADTRALITRWRVGGLVLRGRNVRDAGQVRELTAALQAEAAAAGRGPLFIAADQEGGDVVRIWPGLTRFPSAMALGASGDEDLAQRVGQAAALELLSAGVNVNLAPALDVLTHPDNTVIALRSFGSQAELAGAMGAAFMRGTLAGGALPVIKHYPGHGSSSVDSHAGLPRLEVMETAPFTHAISLDAPVVMVGHLWAPAVDAQPLPASLSPGVIGGLRAGFDGVILTDSLNMAAVTARFSAAEAAVRAFQAGADWLLVAEAGDIPAATQALLEAVRGGQISLARLDDSARRLLALRARLSVSPAPAPSLEAHARLALEAARAGLALTCAAPGCSAQLPSGTRRVLLIAPSRLPAAEAGAMHHSLLAESLAQRGYRVTELFYPAGPPQKNGGQVGRLEADFIRQAELYARAADSVVFGAWDAHRDEPAGQAGLLRRVQAAGRPVIVLGLHTPFDPLALPAMPVYLAVHGDTPAQMLAVAEVLAGAQP